MECIIYLFFHKRSTKARKEELVFADSDDEDDQINLFSSSPSLKSANITNRESEKTASDENNDDVRNDESDENAEDDSDDESDQSDSDDDSNDDHISSNAKSKKASRKKEHNKSSSKDNDDDDSENSSDDEVSDSDSNCDKNNIRTKDKSESVCKRPKLEYVTDMKGSKTAGGRSRKTDIKKVRSADKGEKGPGKSAIDVIDDKGDEIDDNEMDDDMEDDSSDSEDDDSDEHESDDEENCEEENDEDDENLDDEAEDSDGDEEEDMVRWKANIAKAAADSFRQRQSQNINYRKLVYGKGM